MKNQKKRIIKKYTKRTPKIILASQSISRRQQLEDLKLSFTIHPSGVDESVYKKSSLNYVQMCQKIAQAKVEAVAQKHPKALILGGDQMAVLNRQIFNKPLSTEKAIQSLMELQGKTHKLLTALSMHYKGKSFHHVTINTMKMRTLTKSQIKQYVKIANPLQCAGSYALERYGIGLFESIHTSDQSAVIGFPLITLINKLIEWKIPLPFL